MSKERDKSFSDLDKAYKSIEKYVKGHNKHQSLKLIIEGYCFEEWHHPKFELSTLLKSGSDPYQLRIRFRWDKKPSEDEPVIFYPHYQFDFKVTSAHHSTAISQLKECLSRTRK